MRISVGVKLEGCCHVGAAAPQRMARVLPAVW